MDNIKVVIINWVRSLAVQIIESSLDISFQLHHGKYTGWNGCTVEISCWADLAWPSTRIKNSPKNLYSYARTYLQPHYGNGVFGNVYLSAGQH